MKKKKSFVSPNPFQILEEKKKKKKKKKSKTVRERIKRKKTKPQPQPIAIPQPTLQVVSTDIIQRSPTTEENDSTTVDEMKVPEEKQQVISLNTIPERTNTVRRDPEAGLYQMTQTFISPSRTTIPSSGSGRQPDGGGGGGGPPNDPVGGDPNGIPRDDDEDDDYYMFGDVGQTWLLKKLLTYGVPIVAGFGYNEYRAYQGQSSIGNKPITNTVFNWLLPKLKEDYMKRIEPNYSVARQHYIHAKAAHFSYTRRGDRKDLGRYMYNSKLSNEKIAIYNNFVGHFVIAYQGSHNRHDWIKNMEQSFGGNLKSSSFLLNEIYKLGQWMAGVNLKKKDDFALYNTYSSDIEKDPNADKTNLIGKLEETYKYAYGKNKFNFNPNKIKIDLTGHSRGGAVVRAALLDPTKYEWANGKRISEIVTHSHIYNPAVFSNMVEWKEKVRKDDPERIGKTPKHKMVDKNLEDLLKYSHIGRYGDFDKKKIGSKEEYRKHLETINKNLHVHRSEFDVVSYAYDFVENQIGHRLHYNFEGIDSELDAEKAHQMYNWLEMFESGESYNFDREFGDEPNPYEYPT